MNITLKFLLLNILMNIGLAHNNIALSQNTSVEEETIIFPFKKNGLFGYMNQNKEVVIPERFLYVGDFSNNGLAKVIEPYSTFGFINKKGEYVIEPQYSMATSFFGNYAFVYDNNLFYRINKLGEKLNAYDKRIYNIEFTHFAYSDTIVFETKDDLKGLIDIEGKIIEEPIYRDIIPLINNEYAFELEKNNRTFYFIINSNQRTEYAEIYSMKNWESKISKLIGVSTNEKTETTFIMRNEFYQNQIIDFKQNSSSKVYEDYFHRSIETIPLDKKMNITKTMLEVNKHNYYFDDSDNSIHSQTFSPLIFDLGHPYLSVNKIYPLPCDTTTNLYKNDSFKINKDSIILYPKSNLVYADPFAHLFTELEIFHQNSWITPISEHIYYLDGIGFHYQKIDTSFAYVFSKEKYSNIKGDVKTTARLVCKAKDRNNVIKRIVSEPFEINIHSYLLSSLKEKMFYNMLNN